MFAVAPSSCATATPPPARSPWSAPATVTGCSGAWPAAVGYPASSPTAAAGAGAIVCAGSDGGLALAPLPAALAAQPLSLAPGSRPLTGPFAVSTTGDGRIVVAASTVNGAGRGAIIAQGSAGASFGPPRRLGGPGSPLVLGRAYLGDTAVASLTADARHPDVTTGIAVRVQRHFEPAFGPAVAISTSRGPITALDVTLDYRSDALVTWEHAGSIWARVLRANGRLWPLRRVGSSRPRPQLQALISDDNRAIVTWASSTGTRTHVWMSISAPNVVFSAAPRLVESLTDTSGVSLPDGSLRLVRLSTEGVLLAFTGKENNRHVIRAAAVSLNGLQQVAMISDPGADSTLADLATGPHADAVAVWKDAGRQLIAARGVVLRGQASFGPPEPVGPVAGDAAVAIDPATDGAVAAWQRGGAIAAAERVPSK